jgi:hypothetical protein
MTPSGYAIKRLLPGEDLELELLVETFEDGVTVAVRLEMDAKPFLAWVTEPLLPLTATERGQYLFRTRIDGGFAGNAYENTLLKLRTRVLFEKPGLDRRELVSSTVQLDLRGDIRAQFDEQRRLGGEPPTTIINPAPAYVEPPEEIAGFDPASDFAVPPQTRWQNLNRPPVLRPRLDWEVYRVTPERSATLESAQPTPALEPASP